MGTCPQDNVSLSTRDPIFNAPLKALCDSSQGILFCTLLCVDVAPSRVQVALNLVEEEEILLVSYYIFLHR